jgi:hypothetical protein
MSHTIPGADAPPKKSLAPVVSLAEQRESQKQQDPLEIMRNCVISYTHIMFWLLDQAKASRPVTGASIHKSALPPPIQNTLHIEAGTNSNHDRRKS